VSDNGSSFRGETYQIAFPEDRCCTTSARASGARRPTASSSVLGALKYEDLYRAPIDEGGALAMETARFRGIYNRIRPLQALGDRTPPQAYLGDT
jgi:putative transposase